MTAQEEGEGRRRRGRQGEDEEDHDALGVHAFLAQSGGHTPGSRMGPSQGPRRRMHGAPRASWPCKCPGSAGTA
eukprot:7087569-Pyramimonas_sp.AAC.1